MGSYVAEITTIIKLEGIEDFIGIGPIIEVLRGIDIETLDNKHKEAVTLLMKQWREGKRYYR